MSRHDRAPEAEALLATLAETDPRAVSACDGWTVHEVTAHVAGIAVEVIRHLEPYLQGDPVPETRGFEEREAPLQDLDHDTLLGRLDDREARMRALVSDVLEGEPDAVVPWTARQMAVAKFIPHLRNEHALHRWDIAGDDDVSRRLLGQDDLVDHSVGELGEILIRAGRDHDPTPDAAFGIVLHTDGRRPLRVVVSDGTARLTWDDSDRDEPVVELDAQARHVFIWGRRPDDRNRITSGLSQPDLARLQALLSGY